MEKKTRARKQKWGNGKINDTLWDLLWDKLDIQRFQREKMTRELQVGSWGFKISFKISNAKGKTNISNLTQTNMDTPKIVFFNKCHLMPLQIVMQYGVNPLVHGII